MGVKFIQDPESGAFRQVVVADVAPAPIVRPQTNAEKIAALAAQQPAAPPRPLGPLGRLALVSAGLGTLVYIVAAVENKKAERAARASAAMERAQRRLAGRGEESSDEGGGEEQEAGPRVPQWAPLGSASTQPRKPRKKRRGPVDVTEPPAQTETVSAASDSDGGSGEDGTETLQE